MRFWEAERVKSFEDHSRVDTKVVVLREVWLDVDSKSERQIQQEIFADLDKFGQRLKQDPNIVPPQFSSFDDGGENLKAKITPLFNFDDSPSQSGPLAGKRSRRPYEKYFLTILEEGVGNPTRAIATGYRVDPDLLRSTKPMPKSRTKQSTAVGADPSGNNQLPATIFRGPSTLWEEAPPITPLPPRQYRQKRPFRLIYEECCIDLNHKDVTSLQDLFVGLQGCLTGESMR